jgi:hypothetical protein
MFCACGAAERASAIGAIPKIRFLRACAKPPRGLALDSPRDAMLYSVDSMTTRGASGLMLQRHWQMMGALEAADGMLLFGIGTAYMFAVMQA